MYRIAKIEDLEQIMNLNNVDVSKNELERYIERNKKFVYVYGKEDNKISGAIIFGDDSVDDDEYDSEIYGMYTKNGINSDMTGAEILFETKRELYKKGYRDLIIWCDEKNENLKKFFKSSGGRECRKRMHDNSIQVAYYYPLFDLD